MFIILAIRWSFRKADFCLHAEKRIDKFVRNKSFSSKQYIYVLTFTCPFLDMYHENKEKYCIFLSVVFCVAGKWITYEIWINATQKFKT